MLLVIIDMIAVIFCYICKELDDVLLKKWTFKDLSKIALSALTIFHVTAEKLRFGSSSLTQVLQYQYELLVRKLSA